MTSLEQLITQMPKVELHVHLEGSVRPETLLKLAKRHHIGLPADDMEGLRRWYTFRDFNHFIEIYMTISSCLRAAEDIELIAREFLVGQAKQNTVYSEVTFTPFNQFLNNQLGYHEQMDAVDRARAWGEKELGVRMGIIMDIPRIIPPDDGLIIADWAIERYGEGLVAFGLGGPEVDNSPKKYRAAFDRVREAGIPCILHAGETVGPPSIWSAIQVADTKRIGHGVRAVEDPALVEYLRETQIPLEVCPTSNVCLKVYPSLEKHVLLQLLQEGLYVTINSDDPPMFNTTLTNEYLVCQQTFGWNSDTIEQLVLNAVAVSLLPATERLDMHKAFEMEFQKLMNQ